MCLASALVKGYLSGMTFFKSDDVISVQDVLRAAEIELRDAHDGAQCFTPRLAFAPPP